MAAEGDPLPLKVTNGGDDESSISFDHYGDDVDVAAPDASQIVELPAA